MIFLTIEKILCFNDCLDNLYNLCWEKLHHVCCTEGWSRGGEFIVSIFVQFFNTCTSHEIVLLVCKQITMKTSVLASSFWLSYCSNEGLIRKDHDCVNEGSSTVIWFSGIWTISVKDIVWKSFKGFLGLQPPLDYESCKCNNKMPKCNIKMPKKCKLVLFILNVASFVV